MTRLLLGASALVMVVSACRGSTPPVDRAAPAEADATASAPDGRNDRGTPAPDGLSTLGDLAVADPADGAPPSPGDGAVEAGTPACGTTVPSWDRMGEATWPALVFTGTEYGLAWVRRERATNTESLHFARLDLQGRKLEERMVATGATVGRPALVWTGSGYGLTFHSWARETGGALHFARLDQQGQMVGTAVVVSPAVEVAKPSLVWTSRHFALAWTDRRRGPPEVRLLRIDQTGARLGEEVTLTQGRNTIGLGPSLAVGSDGLGAAWYETPTTPGVYSGDVYFAALDEAGGKRAPERRVSAGGKSRNPHIAFGSNHFAVVWSDLSRPSNETLRFARLDRSGAPVGDERNVTGSARFADVKVLVAAGEGFGLLRVDRPTASQNVLMAWRLDATGALAPIELWSHRTRSFDLEGANLVAAGTTFAVAWGEPIVGIRFATTCP